MKTYERQEYLLLTSNTVTGLTGQVNLHLSEGWELFGHTSISPGSPAHMFQALVRVIERPSR